MLPQRRPARPHHLPENAKALQQTRPTTAEVFAQTVVEVLRIVFQWPNPVPLTILALVVLDLAR